MTSHSSVSSSIPNMNGAKPNYCCVEFGIILIFVSICVTVIQFDWNGSEIEPGLTGLTTNTRSGRKSDRKKSSPCN